MRIPALVIATLAWLAACAPVVATLAWLAARAPVVATLAWLAACAPVVDGPLERQRAADRGDGERLTAQLSALPGVVRAEVLIRRAARDPLATAPPAPPATSIVVIIDDRADLAAITGAARALARAAVPELELRSSEDQDGKATAKPALRSSEDQDGKQKAKPALRSSEDQDGKQKAKLARRSSEDQDGRATAKPALTLIVERGAIRPVLASVGPFTVERGSRGPLRAVLAAALLAIAGLAAWIAWRERGRLYRRGSSAQ